MRLWWLLCIANMACLRTTTFHCKSDRDCGDSGNCEGVGYCSFPDQGCPDGRRFGDLSGSYANTCVGALPGVDARLVTIGGTVSGLTGTGLVLRDNGGDDLAVAASGPFTFATALAAGAHYTVTIETPPSGQDAYVGHASGTAQNTVTSITVSCFAAGSDPGVRCDTGIFCTGGQSCCFDKNDGSGTCGTGQCSKVAMPCDSAHECSGGTPVCCARYHNGSGLQDVSCVAAPSACTQSGGTAEILCDSRDTPSPCQGGTACTGSSMLGSAYHTCK